MKNVEGFCNNKMDLQKGVFSMKPLKRDQDLSPLTDLEAERLQKKRKCVIAPLSPLDDPSQYSTSDLYSNSHNSQKSKHEEEMDCSDVLVSTPEPSTQETLESSLRKPDVFTIKRVDFDSSEIPKSAQKSSSRRRFRSSTKRRVLLSCPLKRIYKNGEPVKHEGFVIKVLRGFVKGTLVIVSETERPKTGVFAVLTDNDAAIALWKGLADWVATYKSSILHSIAPENLPATDKNRKPGPARCFQSYNKDFIISFFQRNGYLIFLYYLYCNVVFEASPEVLCKAWRMDCGKGSEHTHGKGCEKRWKALKIYAQKTMLEELGINAYDE